jgi:hypothetical protein
MKYSQEAVDSFVRDVLNLHKMNPEFLPRFLTSALHCFGVGGGDMLSLYVERFCNLGAWEKGNVVHALRSHMDAALLQFSRKLWHVARSEEEEHKKCDHEPDFSSVRYADGTGNILDVYCSKCGDSGSFVVTPEEVDWGDDA